MGIDHHKGLHPPSFWVGWGEGRGGVGLAASSDRNRRDGGSGKRGSRGRHMI